jgi:hypothetical protein
LIQIENALIFRLGFAPKKVVGEIGAVPLIIAIEVGINVRNESAKWARMACAVATARGNVALDTPADGEDGAPAAAYP